MKYYNLKYLYFLFLSAYSIPLKASLDHMRGPQDIVIDLTQSEALSNDTLCYYSAEKYIQKKKEDDAPLQKVADNIDVQPLLSGKEINPWRAIPGEKISLFDLIYKGQREQVYWWLTKSGLIFNLYKPFDEAEASYFQDNADMREKMKNRYGYTIINVVVELGDLAMFELLLAYDRRLAAQIMEKAYYPQSYFNALHLAVYTKQRAICKLLLLEERRFQAIKGVFRKLFHYDLIQDVYVVIKKFVEPTTTQYAKIRVSKGGHSASLPIHIASEQGDTSIVKMLLQCDPFSVYEENFRGLNACQIAAKLDYKEIIELFWSFFKNHEDKKIKKIISIFDGILPFAVNNNSPEVVSYMLTKDKSLLRDTFKDPKRSRQGKYGLTSYQLAARVGNINLIHLLGDHHPAYDFINVLVDEKDNIEFSGCNLLHTAIKSLNDFYSRKKIDTIRLILKDMKEKNPALVGQRVDSCDSEWGGCTALHLLIYRFPCGCYKKMEAFFDTLSLLFEHAPQLVWLRVDNKASDDHGYTPIYTAMKAKAESLPDKKKLITQLLKKDPSPETNLIESRPAELIGLNPLQFAVVTPGCFDAVGETLLEIVPDYLSQVVQHEKSSYKGWNTLGVAIQKGSLGILGRLLAYDHDATLADCTLLELMNKKENKAQIQKFDDAISLLETHIKTVHRKKQLIASCKVILPILLLCGGIMALLTILKFLEAKMLYSLYGQNNIFTT